jgi:hypothetical protein
MNSYIREISGAVEARRATPREAAVSLATMAPLIPVSPDFPVTVRDVAWHRTDSGQRLLARLYQLVGRWPAPQSSTCMVAPRSRAT